MFQLQSRASNLLHQLSLRATAWQLLLVYTDNVAWLPHKRFDSQSLIQHRSIIDTAPLPGTKLKDCHFFAVTFSCANTQYFKFDNLRKCTELHTLSLSKIAARIMEVDHLKFAGKECDYNWKIHVYTNPCAINCLIFAFYRCHVWALPSVLENNFFHKILMFSSTHYHYGSKKPRRRGPRIWMLGLELLWIELTRVLRLRSCVCLLNGCIAKLFAMIKLLLANLFMLFNSNKSSHIPIEYLLFSGYYYLHWACLLCIASAFLMCYSLVHFNVCFVGCEKAMKKCCLFTSSLRSLTI
jgi:hypothetical protein